MAKFVAPWTIFIIDQIFIIQINGFRRNIPNEMHTSDSGPWFRLSTISYSEVLDPQEAVKGLSGNNLVFNIYISCIFLAQISKSRSLLTLPLVILQQWVIYVYLKIKINYMTMTLRRYWICSLFLSYMIFCASLRRFTFIDISIRICILILTQLMLHPLF